MLFLPMILEKIVAVTGDYRYENTPMQYTEIFSAEIKMKISTEKKNILIVGTP